MSVERFSTQDSSSLTPNGSGQPDLYTTTDGAAEGEIAGGNLLHNCVLFGRLMRSLGVQVTPTQVVDLAESLRHVDIGRREDFKNTARTVLVNRREHLVLFEQAFELFWQMRNADERERQAMGEMLQRRQRTGGGQPSTMPSDEADEASDEAVQDRTFAYSYRETLRYKDFAELDDVELDEVKRMMTATEWNLRPRRTRRSVMDRRGALLDMRRTLRASLRHGGESIRLARRNRKLKRRPVVVLCDVSGSMERYARILLQFIYIVTSRYDRVESFVFSTRLTRVSRQLRRRNIDEALDAATAAVTDWGGGTRIGEAIKTFNYVWSRRVLNQGAVVLIISDGWDRGDVTVLGREMDRLHRSCHQLIWLNPLLGAPGYEPLVRGIQVALPHMDEFLPVHNLHSLEQLAAVLAGKRIEC